MKNSQKLNLILAIIMLLILINWISISTKSKCFNWLDYTISFGALFANIGANILATIEE